MRLHLRTLGVGLAVGLLACSVATGQYWTDFEDPPYTGTPAGTILTGQGPGAGFYLPAGATSIDYLCYDYTGNALNIVDHPTGGGDQFVGGTGPGAGTSTYARGQLDITFPDGLLTIWYDMTATHDPGVPVGNNLGSWSIRPVPGDNSYIHLLCWQDLGNPALGYRASYMNYDALGVQVAQPGTSPGPAWENMPLNHWYRCWTLVNRTTNMIYEVAIIDLHSGAAAVHNPVDWYLQGGAGAGVVPTAFRLFAGGGTPPGNTVVWDNVCIGAGRGRADLNCDGKINFDDIDPFVAALSGPAAYYAQYPNCCHQNADCNCDGQVDFDDIDPFVQCLSGICLCP